jgi:hypothetical protein
MSDDKIMPLEKDRRNSARKLSPEAQRALAEADERRRGANPVGRPPEINGPKGPEPIRYGDWERKGIASDF